MPWRLIAFSEGIEFWLAQDYPDEDARVILRSKKKEREDIEMTWAEMELIHEKLKGCKFTEYGAQFLLEMMKGKDNAKEEGSERKPPARQIRNRFNRGRYKQAISAPVESKRNR